LDGTLQEHGLCWLGLFAGHGVHGAGACCALCVAEFRHRGQPGHLPSQQTGNSRSSTSSRLFQQRLLQHSAMHTTAASVGQQDTHRRACTHAHMCTHTHTHAHTHAHAHTHTYTNTRVYTHRHAHTHTLAHAQKHRHTHEHTYARTNTHAHTRTHTHTRACAHTHSHAHMHIHAHVARVMGFAIFLASLATLLHLSTLRQSGLLVAIT
jgi:hypothetical protein